MTMPSIFIRDKPILSSEGMLHKDYDSKGSVEKFIGEPWFPGLTLNWDCIGINE
jgi:hypothetical protein